MDSNVVSSANIPTINMELTGKNIIALREKAGLKVKDIQAMLGFGTPQAIYKWQNGTSLPSIDNLVILALIFHTSIDRILVLNGGQVFF